MTDSRPRNKRPRNRSGKNRLAQIAVNQRQNQHISALKEALEPEALALAESIDKSEVVDRIRAQATTLATDCLTGDVAPIVEATLDEIFGLGPLEPALRDPATQTIRIEGAEVLANGELVLLRTTARYPMAGRTGEKDVSE